jgi:hypothetical protein
LKINNSGFTSNIRPKKIIREAFESIISKNQHRVYMSELVAERIASRMEAIQLAQDRFAKAMTRYAAHLESHTSAIEGLNKASHELAKSAAEHNNILTRLVRLLELSPAGVEKIIPQHEEEIKAENAVVPSGCQKRWQLQNKDEQNMLFLVEN